MATIPNFPDDLADQHHHWHKPAAHPGAGPGRLHPRGTPGGGLEFLTFHRNFVAQFHSWYDVTPFNVAPFNDPVQKTMLVRAWTAVPFELQTPAHGWPPFADDAARLDSGVPDFATADELGTYIELGIHDNFLHGAAAAEYNEPVLATLHSPHITEFYGIHGLVSHWWGRWQRQHKIRMKELVFEIDSKRIRKEVMGDLELKAVLRDTSAVDPQKRVDDVKMVAHEVPDSIFNGIDPVLTGLSARLDRLEREAFPGRVFIEGERRPNLEQIKHKASEAHEAHEAHE